MFTLVTAICAYGCFFQCIYWIAGLRDVIIQMNLPLFDDLQNVNVLITMFALIGGASIGIFV
jgi:cytochrome c oxidase subunit 1